LNKLILQIFILADMYSDRQKMHLMYSKYNKIVLLFIYLLLITLGKLGEGNFGVEYRMDSDISTDFF